MTLDDVDAVVDLDGRAFGESGWSRRHFVGELSESPISILYVLVDQRAQLIAYFGTWHVVDQLHLCTFAVDPDHQGEGFGGLLLGCVIRLAQRLGCAVIQLEVRESNHAARSLYQSRGFVEEAIRRNLYSKPTENGVLMSMSFPACNQSVQAQARQRWPNGLNLQWDDRGGKLDEHWPNG